MKRFKQFRLTAWQAFTRQVSPAMLATILAGLVVGFLLFVPPLRGLADDGTFPQILANNGLYRLSGYQTTTYVNPQLGIMRYFNELRGTSFTAQTLFIQVAILVNKLVHSQTVFDVRFLGLTYTGPYLGRIYLLTKALTQPYRRIRSYFLAVAVVLVFADAAFILSFNSFYATPVMVIGMLYVVATTLLVARLRTMNWRLVIGFFGGVALLVTATPQNGLLVLCFVIASGGFFFVVTRGSRWLWLLAGLLMLLILGGLSYTSLSSEQRAMNRYQSFTHGVLTQDTDASQSLEHSGISPQYGLMKDEDYYPTAFTAQRPSSRSVQRHLIQRYTGVWVSRYYLQHPRQFLTLLDLAASDMMMTQNKSVGDYQKGAGKAPGAQVTLFTSFSAAAGSFFPERFAFNVLLVVALLMIFAVGVYNDLRAQRVASVVRFFLVCGLLLIFISVPIMAIIGGGTTALAQRLLMVPLSIDMVLLIFLADMLNHRLWHADDAETEV
ncbi:glycan biosynthesis hexose transferase WsfD [Levilactobacillus enshiensis]|uniref:glycan biosynthesis hexose transferase WsfD n=1 Tax=Levilactobacillus enshiensis TaxID=2590213 RepID=UPI00117BA590|nr:hypothetical protein [Levilactobacillus enshiensis]